MSVFDFPHRFDPPMTDSSLFSLIFKEEESIFKDSKLALSIFNGLFVVIFPCVRLKLL